MTYPPNYKGNPPATARSPLDTGAAPGAQIVGSQHALHGGEGPGPFLMLADTLTGNDVVNLANEELGDIKGIMLDVQRGRVAYAVMSVGGFLGMGTRLFAIPWQALKLDTDNKRFILDADKARLEKAPGFDKDHWPTMADPTWAIQVHSYYGTRPYWE